MRIVFGLVMVIGFTLALVGCDNSSSTSAKKDSAQPADALPADLIVTSEPTGARDIVAIKGVVKDGDAVVLRARVGGAKDPLAENRAIMTLADLSLPTCDKTPMDTCKTPWDSCCEPRETLVAKTATVQVVGADGKPLHATLTGVAGIAPLKHVVVSGIARTTAGSDVLTVDAKQIYVVPQ